MMIFVTAGTQLPFDRLLRTIDEMAVELTGVKFVVQAAGSNYKPQNIEIERSLTSDLFDKYIETADLIVSHAGTGTIISALVKGKPIVVMPRLAKYNEHRNDHQLATSEQMDVMNYVHVAYDEHELKKILRANMEQRVAVRRSISNEASHEMINSLNTFIKY